MYGALAGLANFDPGRRLSLTSLLPMLQQDEANEHCADCGTQMPEWCSLNLGCLLCIECSGIHRSLGTHISKVRSLTLDVISFTPVTISMLLSTGNALNADVFEPLARRTGSGGGGVLLQKPSADGSRGEKQQYIHAKYVAREFTFWDAESATALLFAAIEVGDLSATMRSLALGAGLNAMRQIPTHTDDVSVAATPLAAAL
ncbi:ArfGap-domain-containing protein, partial [Martensiomyces pterosporus]